MMHNDRCKQKNVAVFQERMKGPLGLQRIQLTFWREIIKSHNFILQGLAGCSGSQGGPWWRRHPGADGCAGGGGWGGGCCPPVWSAGTKTGIVRSRDRTVRALLMHWKKRKDLDAGQGWKEHYRDWGNTRANLSLACTHPICRAWGNWFSWSREPVSFSKSSDRTAVQEHLKLKGVIWYIQKRTTA